MRLTILTLQLSAKPRKTRSYWICDDCASTQVFETCFHDRRRVLLDFQRSQSYSNWQKAEVDSLCKSIQTESHDMLVDPSQPYLDKNAKSCIPSNTFCLEPYTRSQKFKAAQLRAASLHTLNTINAAKAETGNKGNNRKPLHQSEKQYRRLLKWLYTVHIKICVDKTSTYVH
jgi:hypothetical protein